MVGIHFQKVVCGHVRSLRPEVWNFTWDLVCKIEIQAQSENKKWIFGHPTKDEWNLFHLPHHKKGLYLYIYIFHRKWEKIFSCSQSAKKSFKLFEFVTIEIFLPLLQTWRVLPCALWPVLESLQLQEYLFHEEVSISGAQLLYPINS